ncbi:MAG: hypothetical protein IPJ71_17915 [Bdellovibrionales bacterium]|nr:hypothetical protein [Bdellovibrionales bacterium]
MKEHEENRREPGGFESCQHRIANCGLIIPVILLLLALSVAEQRASAQDQFSAVVVNSWFKFYGPHDFRRSQYPYFSSSNGCGPDIMRETVIGSALNKMLNEVTLNVDERSIKISFANLCNAHDRCYMTMGKTKAECDRNLNQAMYEHCNKLEVGFQPNCSGIREAYMRSIRSTLGDSSFKIAQEQQKRYESIIAENTPELRAYALKTSEISAVKSEGGGGYLEVGTSFKGSFGSYSSVSGAVRSPSLDDRRPLTLKGQGAI